MRKYIILLLLCGFIGNAQYNLFARQNFAHKIVSTYDADAQAFITAAGLTDNTQKNAINTLVISLKGYGLWIKMKAIYPIIGGTSFTHKWNLKDPRDLNIAYRLIFTTTNHTSTGINLISGAGGVDTNLNPFTELVDSDNHMSNYCYTDNDGLYIDMGNVAAGTYYSLYNSFSNVFYSDNPNSSNRISVSNTISNGFYTSSRTSSVSHKGYKNGASITSTAASMTGTFPNNQIGLLHAAGAGTPYTSNRTYNFFTIGSGLTDTDASNLYTAVLTFETTLGRN